MTTTTRRGLLGAIAAAPALAAATTTVLTATPAQGANGDKPLLDHFEDYARLVSEVETRGDIDDPDCAICAAWNAARNAIDESAPPTTVAGAIASLRFGLAVNNTNGDEQAILLEGTVLDRAEWCREHWDDLDIDDQPFWGALVALEVATQRALSGGEA